MRNSIYQSNEQYQHISKDVIKQLLINPKDLVDKNHFVSKCPFCNKDNHFYFNYLKLKWDCKKCGEEGSIIRLLNKLQRLDLLRKTIDFENLSVHIRNSMVNSFSFEESIERNFDLLSKVEKISFPEGTRLIKPLANKYLNSRGFGELEYEKYLPKRCLFAPYDKFVLIPVIEEGVETAFVGRNYKEVDYIDNYGNERKVQRYKNSESVFSNLLFGIDDVDEDSTIVLVEGIFGKVRLDRFMRNIDPSINIKFLSTFGKKISEAQMLKLYLKGVKNVMILFDPDAVSSMKKMFRKDFFRHFDVTVAYNVNNSPDEYENENELIHTLEKFCSLEEFFLNYVPLKLR